MRTLAACSRASTRTSTRESASSAPPEPTRAARRRDDGLAQRQEKALLNLVEQGRLADALGAAQKITDQFPTRGLGWKIQGALLWASDLRDRALDAMRTAVTLLPDDAEVHGNLGATLATMDRFDEAEAVLRQTLRIDPGFAAAHVHLGNVYQLQGRYADAERSLRAAVALQPPGSLPPDLRHSSLLFLLSHDPAIDADALFAEHCRIGDVLESGLRAAWPKHANHRDPERRLEVGFVSGDLCNHAVAHFIEPVLAQLAQYSTLRLHAYYNNTVNDEVTQRLRAHFARWQPVADLSDGRLAAKIAADRIDVLVDLAGHTALNRLKALARKPAPLQASWIGYPGTTGLHAMDYYLADAHFLPPERFERHFREKLILLPANVPFRPDERAPPVNDLPALTAPHFTLGSFNRLGKITPATLSLWSALLRALPRARLLVGGVPAGGEADLAGKIADQGVAPERLAFRRRCPVEQYLAHHHEVDLCLDTLPYGGGTTTIHALWMGVPTLTVAGPTPASRQGAAILGQLGLEDFVARDAADFIAKGCYWAEHLEELAALRRGLRERWQRSPARDPAEIAGSLERALRHAWTRWCAGLPPASFRVSRFAHQEDARA